MNKFEKVLLAMAGACLLGLVTVELMKDSKEVLVSKSGCCSILINDSKETITYTDYKSGLPRVTESFKAEYDDGREEAVNFYQEWCYKYH